MAGAIRIVAIAVLGVLVAAIALLWIFQRSLIYPAPPAVVAAPSGFALVTLNTADGLALRAAYRPAPPGQPVILFFHGNGDSLAGAATATAGYRAAGYGVLLVEYRGYGGNPGHPSESGLDADGEAALAFLRAAGIADSGIFLIGNSLGSGVSTQLAARHRLAGLIIISGYTRLTDVVRDMAQGLPVGWLVRDRFANIETLPRVSAPVLVLHGRRDRVIDFSHGVALAATARTPLLAFPDAGHELAYRRDAQAAVAGWIDRHRQAAASPVKAQG